MAFVVNYLLEHEIVTFRAKRGLYFIPVYARLLQPNLLQQDRTAYGQELPDTALVSHRVHVPSRWLFWIPHGVASGQQLRPVRDSGGLAPSPTFCWVPVRLASPVTPACQARQEHDCVTPCL